MKDKLNLAFKPFVLALAGLVVGYSFLNRVLFVGLDLFSLKEIVRNFGIPVVLTGLVVLFILRPKLKVLNLQAKRGNWRDFYSFIAWVILIIPLIIAQEYIITATGKLTELNSINEINNTAPTKFYTVKSHYISKKTFGTHAAFDVSGKYSDNFNMHIYFVMPIFEKEEDSSIIEPFAWIGVTYNKTINNRLRKNEKEEKYKEFANESLTDFNNKNVSAFIYLNRVENSDERDGYIAAIRNNPRYEPCETVLVGVNEPFEERNGKKSAWLLGSALTGSLVWLLLVLIPKIDPAQLKRIKAGKPDKAARKEIKGFIDILKPKDGFFITLILSYINIGIFLLMVIMGLGFISFQGLDLLNWGANFRPITTDGQWWRLLSNTFLHGGLMHLLANMYGLIFVGFFLEPLLGRLKFLTTYLLTGILASTASIWWYDAIVSVGASGAIFGLYGVFLALLLTKVYPPEFAKSFLISTAVFVGFNLLMGLAGGIDNAAHIGGLLSGFIIGLIMSPSLKLQIQKNAALKKSSRKRSRR